MSAFLDTNILVYAYAIDRDEKWRTAIRLLEEGASISVQCLNEFAAVARRKLGFDWPTIETASDYIVDLCTAVQPLTLGIHQHGLMLTRSYGLSLWDGMIVAAAIESGCDTLYSEDMHAGLVVDGRLRVVNPFA